MAEQVRPCPAALSSHRCHAAADPLALPAQTERAFQKQLGVNVGCAPGLPRCAPVAAARFWNGAAPGTLGAGRAPAAAQWQGTAIEEPCCSGLIPLLASQLQEAREEDPRQGRSALLQERWPGLQDPQGGHRGCADCSRPRRGPIGGPPGPHGADGADGDTRPRARSSAGTYIDRKCPFTGDVAIRGRILSGAPSPGRAPSRPAAQPLPARSKLGRAHSATLRHAGTVKSTKMTRTIVVRRDYLHYVKKYARCAAARPPRMRARLAGASELGSWEPCWDSSRGGSSSSRQKATCSGGSRGG
jgi:hypothetical protein